MKRKTFLAIVIPAVLIAALIVYSVLSGKEKEIVLGDRGTIWTV